MAGVVKFNEAKSFAPVAGEFEGTFMGLTFVPESKSSGKPAAKFAFTLTDAEVEGRKVATTKSLAPEGMWSTKEYLIAIGADPEELEGPVEDIEEYAAQFIGNTVRLGLSKGTYRDPQSGTVRETQQVNWVKSQYDL